jgi:hypothetical protein
MRVKHLQIILVILTTIFIVISYTSVIARTIRTDSSRVNIFIHGFSMDYMFYLAGIVRGQHGFFWFKDPFSVPHPAASPLFLLFSLIGIISAPFGVWTPAAYHISRVLLVFFSVWAIYVLAVTVLKSKLWGSVATILAIITAIPPQFFYSEKIAMTFYSWWTYLSVVGRFEGLPHHLAARGLQCLSIAWYLQYRSTKRLKFLVISSVAATISVFLVPQTVVPYVVIFITSVMWDSVSEFRKTKNINVFFRGLYLLLALLGPVAAVGIVELATLNPMWIANKQWELTYFSKDTWANYHHYVSYILFLIPAYAGFVILFKKQKLLSIQLLIWILIPLLFTPILPMLGTSTVRFALFMNLVIPFSILATFAFREAMQVIFWKRVTIIYIILICLYLPFNVFGYAKLEWNMVFAENLSTRLYPPKEYFELVDWVKKNVPEEHVILASDEIGSLLASQTPVFAYIGEQSHGANWDLYKEPHRRFYAEEMTNDEAIIWLKKHDVAFVVEDPKFIWPFKDLSYPFLVKRWQNSQLGIYEVKYDFAPKP